MAKKTGKKGGPTPCDLSRAQALRLVSFLERHTTAHGIAREEMLQSLVDEVGDLTLEKEVATRAKDTFAPSSFNVRLVTKGGFRVASARILPGEWFRLAVAREGLGGYVPDGEWWGFNCLQLVTATAECLGGYSSNKIGRGGMWYDGIDGIKKFANALPE